MQSIQSRLSTGLALALVAVFFLLFIGVSLSFRYLTEAYMATRLDHDTESLLSAIHFNANNGALEIRGGRINPIYRRAFSGHYYRIDIDEQVIRSRSLWDQNLIAPKAAVGETKQLRVDGPENQLLLVRVAGFIKDKRAISIAVAEDLTPIKADVRQFQRRFILFCLAALALLLLLQRYVLRVGLAPVRRTCDEISALARGERERLSEMVPAEVQPQVQEINRLIAVMQQRLKRSRTALGNLAHALKTPLTLATRLAERKEMAQCPDIQNELRQHIDRMRVLMDRELKRARLAGAASTGTRLQLAEEIDDLLTVLKAIYRDRNIIIKTTIVPDIILIGDKEDILELLGNLLDNAFKWARQQIQISASRDGDNIQLSIEDDGPGRTEAEMESLQRRGVRTDEDAMDGHGLGISIVQDVLQQYQGEISFSRSGDLGGFRVDLTLPMPAKEM